MPELLARTVRLDRAVDPVEVASTSPDGLLFVRDGVGLAGVGVAGRWQLADIDRALAAIVVADEVGLPGCGPVAFGALPFRPGTATELIVPALLVGRAEDGTSWATAIGPRGHDLDPAALVAALPVPAAPGPGPSSFTVEATLDPDLWCRRVAQATESIRTGALEKVVLAREVVVTADADLPIDGVLGRLRASYPSCFLYHFEGFVGASPELLVGRSGDVVRSQPMAGTTARRGDPQADARAAAALLADPSYRHEHQVTIDEVHETLLQFCSFLDYEAQPSVVALANVAHLATMVEGRLSHPPASVLDLVQALHPTPAVCGRPREAALELISELEGFDRGRYAGAVGWVDGRGNGQWAVAIRSAQIDGPTARVIAGNGLVADSNPVIELAETRAKLQALLGALIRP